MTWLGAGREFSHLDQHYIDNKALGMNSLRHTPESHRMNTRVPAERSTRVSSGPRSLPANDVECRVVRPCYPCGGAMADVPRAASLTDKKVRGRHSDRATAIDPRGGVVTVHAHERRRTSTRPRVPSCRRVRTRGPSKAHPSPQHDTPRRESRRKEAKKAEEQGESASSISRSSLPRWCLTRAGFILCASEAPSYQHEHVAPNGAFAARGRLFERDTASPELALVASAYLLRCST